MPAVRRRHQPSCAPSLFIWVTSGYAYGAVFTSATRAPLTSLASVVEMSGDFSLTLPVMLAVAVASAISRALSYDTIYTAKLLRRGTDIDRAAPGRALADLRVTDVMRPFSPALDVPPSKPDEPDGRKQPDEPGKTPAPGPVVSRHEQQSLFASETLAQALRQLEVYGRDGLPVLSADGRRLEGWITTGTLLRAWASRSPASSRARSPPRRWPARTPALPRDARRSR